jgi:hypothetical protein
MLHIANAELTVDLLDPVAEHAHLGPRFCWGAYIWQIHDQHVGDLLTGPEWPKPDPIPRNGQGLPESFRHSTMTGQPLLWDGPIGLAPGAGQLSRDAEGNVSVTQPCQWESELTPTQAIFRTAQTVGHWSYEIERTIALEGRHLRSTSRLTNRGRTPLKFEWFAHPFFALQTDGLQVVTLPVGTQLAENIGYKLTGRTLTLHRPFIGVDGGHLELLGLPMGQPLVATLTHPKLSSVHFTTDFVPFKCVLWANGNTLSLEPYLALNLAPGETREWNLTYDFGPAK